MNNKLGRNDPCHCGSGKKYKKCHLELDAQQERAELSALEELPAEFTAQDSSQLASQLRKLATTLPANEQGQAEKAAAFAELYAAYEASQPKILAAIEKLQNHNAEFQYYSQNPQVFLDDTSRLIRERSFAPIWFSAEEAQAACEQTGFDPAKDNYQEQTSLLQAALDKIVDETRRNCLIVHLFLRLPEFVAAGKFKEGWILYLCAKDTLENRKARTPILLLLLLQGYMAWKNKRLDQLQNLLRDMGAPLEATEKWTQQQLGEWLNTACQEPEKRAKFEAFMAANPDFLKAKQTGSMQADEAEDWLLNQPEVKNLLTFEDKKLIVPLVAEIEDKWRAYHQGKIPSRALSETEKGDLADIVYTLCPRMVEVVFKPDRINQLKTDLEKYRQEKLTANDEAAARAALQAILSLGSNLSPADNTFLIGLCFNSIRNYPLELFPAFAETKPPADSSANPASEKPKE